MGAFILLTCCLLGLTQSGAPSAEPAARAARAARPSTSPAAERRNEWIDRVWQMDTPELVRELSRAQRISWTGQKLIKMKAICQAAAAQAEFDLMSMSSDPAVKRCENLLGQPEAKARLNELMKLPEGEIGPAYTRFLAHYQLDHQTLQRYQKLLAARHVIKDCTRMLAKIKDLLDDDEFLSREVVPDISASAGSTPPEMLDQVRAAFRELKAKPRPPNRGI